MGPNNQLEGFLESVFLAIKLNRLKTFNPLLTQFPFFLRTMCIPPFFRHKTDEALSSSISADLRINRKKLSEFVTFCDTEQIQEKCPKLDTVWWGSNPKTLTCGISLQKRYKTFQMLTGLENWYSVSNLLSIPPSSLTIFGNRFSGFWGSFFSIVVKFYLNSNALKIEVENRDFWAFFAKFAHFLADKRALIPFFVVNP